MRELNGVSGISKGYVGTELYDAFGIGQMIDGVRFTFVVFTDRIVSEGGRRVARYIRWHNLGTIKHIAKSRNPNTGNVIEGWMWTINRKGLSKWLQAQYRKR